MNFTNIKKRLAQFAKQANLPHKVVRNGKEVFIALEETENSTSFLIAIQQNGFTYQFAHLRTVVSGGCFLYKLIPKKWRTKCELNLGTIETLQMSRSLDWFNRNFIPHEKEVKIRTNSKHEIRVFAAAIERKGEMQGVSENFAATVDIEANVSNFMNDFSNGF